MGRSAVQDERYSIDLVVREYLVELHTIAGMEVWNIIPSIFLNFFSLHLDGFFPIAFLKGSKNI
ncbi:MAG: hypothetical protein J7L63_01885 [Thermoplasmata archaeon]|nr:hypothetical protein [Thermoplasmata archaeon]